jgi:predicted RNA polymerase sigma factor
MPAVRRVDGSRDIIPLAEQDRGLWDRGQIVEGVAVLDRAIGAVASVSTDPAAIAASRPCARCTGTDWPQILALYGRAHDRQRSYAQQAVATGMAEGPTAGPRSSTGWMVRSSEPSFEAVRAHLLEW